MQKEPDHLVFSPKYRGKMLVDDVAMICEGIICKTCIEMSIEIIEIAVNPDHVHIFFKYPPKYSVSYQIQALDYFVRGLVTEDDGIYVHGNMTIP